MQSPINTKDVDEAPSGLRFRVWWLRGLASLRHTLSLDLQRGRCLTVLVQRSELGCAIYD